MPARFLVKQGSGCMAKHSHGHILNYTSNFFRTYGYDKVQRIRLPLKVQTLVGVDVVIRE